MIRAVLDTNVLISALFWKGNPEKIVRKCLEKEIIGVTSPAILRELEKKLLSKFKYPSEETRKYIELLIKEFEVVSPRRKVKVVKDADDNKIIEAAIEAKAKYVVSGDSHLLDLKEYEGIQMVGPREFLGAVIRN